ncbi:MAG: hypothetical protein JNJ70_26560 [Verrucomicrobiales bacterium]|jgi:hypothetical protein|nr:hypothetical protein [Verrucomicrobiales bacterium]
MKKTSLHALAATLLGGVSSVLLADEIPLSQCPEPVRETIRGNTGLGRIDEIKTIRMENRVLYLAEIDLPGKRERKLHIAGDGALLKMIEEIRPGDLPRKVKSTMDTFLAPGGRFDSADRVTAGGKVEYHVDLDLADDVDLHLVIDENGGILRRREEADF